MLSTTIEIKVRFCEVDSIGMVWHGHYPKYMEDAREEFGREHGLSYESYIANKILAPIVDMNISYKSSAYINDILTVKIEYRKCKGSKLIFDYIIKRKNDNRLIAIASTTQLFTDMNGNLICSTPAYIEQWRKENQI